MKTADIELVLNGKQT